ncbi:hypothetical protein [Paraburkholderia sp. GAS348]|uniref:hypothetical protein n=1 Tax=Paraburkholderia sp. GAS348 TaxID=3035132 RepID=UPI003D25D1FC
MTIDPPRSVVLNYDQDSQTLNVQLVGPAKLASFLAGKFTVPILLDEFDFRLDDEFFRGLGATMLNLIALGQPDVKEYMSVTQRPIDRPSGQKSAAGRMAKHPRYSVVLTYIEDRQEFAVQAVDRARLAPFVAGTFKAPILLDEHNFRLDDAFARRLGAAMLSLIALGQPDIKQYISVTHDPID